jgi:CheY-like chemotaxis protein
MHVLQQIVPTKSGSSGLEFLVVCNDSNVFRILDTVIQDVRGRLNCAPSAESAMNYLARRKADGIVIDMRIPGALDLVVRVRTASSNRFSIVFACIGSAQDAKIALQAGANFVLNEPLETAAVAESFKAALAMMSAERRRFLRYALMLPVVLKLNGATEDGTMANLSEGGMAIWNLRHHVPATILNFGFTLPFGGLIEGKAEIAWTNGEGTTGIRFHILPDQAYTHLFKWLTRRDRPTFRPPLA